MRLERNQAAWPMDPASRIEQSWRRSEFAGLSLLVYFFAWQALSALSQSAIHCLRRKSQDPGSLPRAMHWALRLPHVTLQLSNFSAHLSGLTANTIITPLESANSATHVLRFMR
jgi:hypothetical protein